MSAKAIFWARARPSSSAPTCRRARSRGGSRGARSGRREVEVVEAHLVGRLLAPGQVGGRLLDAADDGLIGRRVVVRAFQVNGVAGDDGDRLLVVIELLPVKVPVRDVDRAGGAAVRVIDGDGDLRAVKMHVRDDAPERPRAVDG